MSKREWKPGDVAMVECGDGKERPAMLFGSNLRGDVWKFADGALRDADWSEARPLVVIDPEDREQVERLIARYLTIYDGMDAVPSAGEIASMQAALREFAVCRWAEVTHQGRRP